MKYITESFRNGEIILNEASFKPFYDEVLSVIGGISDRDIKQRHLSKYSGKMSLSYAINNLLKERLKELEWKAESPIFQGDEYSGNKWRLDFAKGKISIEVAFNHGEAIAWNLLKPVLASSVNNVKKSIDTEAAIIITATKNLKKKGVFDSAVGEFEKFKTYLKPLSSVLNTPMVIIGLEAPETFRVEKEKVTGRNVGKIVRV